MVRKEAVERLSCLVNRVLAVGNRLIDHLLQVAPVVISGTLAAVCLAASRCRLFLVVVVLGVAVVAEEQGLAVAVPLTSVVLHTRLRTAQCRKPPKESAARVQSVLVVLDVVSPSCLV